MFKSGDELILESGTTDIELIVESLDPLAEVDIAGDSGLVTGNNTLVVRVTASDGETVAEYTISLYVLPSSDTSLSVFQVNGVDVEDGDTVELAPGSTDIELVIETTNPAASYEVSGDDGLFVGTNELVVTVTAENGQTREFVVLLEVPANDDASVASITVNGEVVSADDILELDNGTTDPEATYEISGETGLVAGENTLTIIVTAADGTTVEEFSLTVKVLGDASLSVFEINGSNVQSGDELILESGTTILS